MNLRTRLDGIEGRRNRGTREVIRIDPEAWPRMAADELADHKANIRRALANPAAILIILADEGDPDPLAALLGSDDPALIRHRGQDVRITRSYGTAG